MTTLQRLDLDLLHYMFDHAPDKAWGVMVDRETGIAHLVVGYYTACHQWLGGMHLGAVPFLGAGYQPCLDCTSTPKQLALFEVEA